MSQDMSRFWTTYHALLDHEDQDGLPDPLMHEAAHWMNQCYSILKAVAICDQDDRPLGVAESAFDWRRRSMKQEDIARSFLADIAKIKEKP